MKVRLAILLFLVVGLPLSMAGRTKDIYIALRTDGLVGEGTLQNPFDGSTPTKLDAVLRRIANGTRVHFGPGTFQTAGFSDDSSSVGFSVKRGCKYIGTGMSRTTIQLTAASASSGHLASAFQSTGYNGDVSRAEVRDMTIDLNGAAIVAGGRQGVDMKTQAVSINGSNCTVANVHAIRAYGHFATYQEAFVIIISSPVVSGSQVPAINALIDHCIVDQFAVGNDHVQAIGLSGGTSIISGIIKNCSVKDLTTSSSAYVAYATNAVLRNCYAANVDTFLYMDTGSVGPLWVYNCHATRLANHFVQIGGSAGFTYHDITVSDCRADFSSTDVGGFFSVQGNNTTMAYNLNCYNNTVTGALYRPFSLGNVDGLNEGGNRWLGTPRYLPQFWGSGVSNVRFDCYRKNDNSSLSGSIKLTGNFSPGGSLFYQFAPTAYTVASGDRLKYEILCAKTDISFRPTIYIEFSDESTTNPLRDQNGVATFDNPGANDYADVGRFAKSRWYARDFDLTPYAGKSSSLFKFGYGGNDPACIGIHTFYIRNIRIVDKTGSVKQVYDIKGAGAPSLVSNASVTNYSATVFHRVRNYHSFGKRWRKISGPKQKVDRITN